MDKKFLLLFILLVLCSSQSIAWFGNSPPPPTTIPQLEELFCEENGNCSLVNLNVSYLNVKNYTIENIDNITGAICLDNVCYSSWSGLNDIFIPYVGAINNTDLGVFNLTLSGGELTISDGKGLILDDGQTAKGILYSAAVGTEMLTVLAVNSDNTGARQNVAQSQWAFNLDNRNAVDDARLVHITVGGTKTFPLAITPTTMGLFNPIAGADPEDGTIRFRSTGVSEFDNSMTITTGDLNLNDGLIDVIKNLGSYVLAISLKNLEVGNSRVGIGFYGRTSAGDDTARLIGRIGGTGPTNVFLVDGVPLANTVLIDSLSGGGSNGIWLHSAGTGDINFFTNSLNRMRIENTGQVLFPDMVSAATSMRIGSTLDLYEGASNILYMGTSDNLYIPSGNIGLWTPPVSTTGIKLARTGSNLQFGQDIAIAQTGTAFSTIYGARYQSIANHGTGTIGTNVGFYGYAKIKNAGDVTSMIGSLGEIDGDGGASTGAVTNAYVFMSENVQDIGGSTATWQNVYNFYGKKSNIGSVNDYVFGGDDQLNFQSGEADGGIAYQFDTKNNFTSGTLFDIRNLNDSKMNLDYNGKLSLNDLYVTNDTNVGGDLYVAGNIYNNDEHMHGLVTAIHSVAVVDTWYNLTFNNTLGDVAGINFTENKTVVITSPGHYTISFGMGFLDNSPAPNSNVAMRITRNGIEIIGSYIEEDIVNRQNEDIWLEHLTHIELNIGDKLNMQYIASDTSVNIETEGTYATQNFHAYGYIQKVAPT